MAITNQNRKPLNNSGFLDIIERYWLVLLGLLIGYPIIMRYFKDASTKDTINNQEEKEKLVVASNQNPVDQKKELDKYTTNPFYQNLARNIAHDLGTNIANKEAGFWSFSWLNPTTWTENDTAVYNSLKQLVDKGQVRVVTSCYYVLTRRNLMDDVKSYLDSELLAKLPLFR